ncbi:MAG: disulfide bond formation protein DsbA, partial [Candidatus Komeilibacteria bacterium CG_4_9_14_3_um_filter_37_5]
NAKVVMVEFSDYECPFCARHHETMLQIMNQYKDQVAWVFRHFPLDSIHPQARPAALAAECANEQDKFWEYSDAIYKDQDKLSGGISFLQQVAKQLKLNESKFNDCLSSAKYQSKVDADYQEGIANGVSGTPGTFIAGQLIKGAVPFESFKQIIDQALNAN